ncbi:ABC transporter substrate-binding protein [Variovorax paradoxus]|uniref:tripartite tricarboxylate transporter substrate-binding protein n=1 Tax=Variovorax TaxID=34072 RepID=UPI0006E59540|nr:MULTISPECIES: tripartite tricarboxylate transporter substrate-binding protein [unclassified Variovorax]KPU90809.1 ABC transporter substrate-binding protein [Variovorax paradoxus]KPV04147.1 ABC transporter substrate-binding protein [Variovorax paradoxus]KPV10517.1 ABC transporter substrate-binding protein [Variovorax paradoxus]KPV15280.1 ABC transporter substrate-binding protein [Variovorax paradoxus]KPV32435.1 ABC transporter substrate-binding protein [Variovorax paradoxus]
MPFFPSRRRLAACCLALAIGGILAPAQAQNLESPLTLVVGYAPGGSTDRIARLIAERLGPKLGVAVTVENRAGEGGRLAAKQLRRAAATENVLMLGNPAVMVVAPLVIKDAGYDPDKDFVPVTQVSSYDFALAVGQKLQLDRAMFLVGRLWAHPEEAVFGVPATGSLPHFFGLMVGDALSVQPQIKGYGGSAPLAADLTGGSLPIAIDTLDSLYAQHVAGKIRILAVSGKKRASFAPSLPTFREAGMKIDADGWNTFFAPSSMPPAKVQLLAAKIREVMQDPGLQKAADALYITPVVSSNAETVQMLKAYRQQWEPVVRRSGFAP